MLFAGVVTVLEIGFLYWNSLRGVAQVSRLAGLPYPSASPTPPAVQLTIHGVDWPTTLRAYAQLTGQPQQAVLAALSQATLLSGPLRGARQRFLDDVFATCQTPLPHRQLNDLQRRLNTGQDWPS
ncbi:hypothetical protein RVM26_09205 [Halomonas sp. KM072]